MSKPYYSVSDETVRVARTGPSKLYATSIRCPDGSARFLQLFDVADAGDVTLGTTAPSYVVPIAGSSLEPTHVSIPDGLEFANGIAHACTTTATGSSGPTADADLSMAIR